MAKCNEIVVKVWDMARAPKESEEAERIVRKATLEWALEECKSKDQEARAEERKKIVPIIQQIITDGMRQENEDWIKTWWLVKDKLQKLRESLKKGEL
jgi:hypothetical protein